MIGITEYINEKSIDKELKYVADVLLDLLLQYNKLKENDWKSKCKELLNKTGEQRIYFSDFIYLMANCDKSKSVYKLERETEGLSKEQQLVFIYQWFVDNFSKNTEKGTLLNNINKYKQYCFNL